VKNNAKKHFGLDNTLRYLAYPLLYRGHRIVAIEFMHRGKRYKADTAGEAAEMRQLLEQQDREAGTTSFGFLSAFLPRMWNPDEALELVEGLGELQKEFLAKLMAGASLPSEMLYLSMKLDSEVALAGVISGLSKQARKMGHNSRELYEVQVEWTGKTKERFFRIQPGFKMALDEIGWPDIWKEKKSK
jgi:hypothetical protein